MSTTTALSASAPPSPVPPQDRPHVGHGAVRARLAAATLLPLLLLALSAGGCDKTDKDAKGGEGKPAAATTPGTISVGYVDLRDIAKQLRWEQEIESKIKGGKADLDRQSESFERQIARAVEEKNRSVAAQAKLTEQQIKELGQVQNAQALERLLPNKQHRDDLLRTHANAAEYINRSRALANQAHGQWANEVQKAYVDALRPIIRQVAQGQGVTSVMTKVDVVVYIDPAADLTNKVVDEAQKKVPSVTVPEVPKLQLPEVHLQNPPAPQTAPAAPSTIAPTTRGTPSIPPIGGGTPPR